jgi:geranylgeranyl pyrophosphate synthase
MDFEEFVKKTVADVEGTLREILTREGSEDLQKLLEGGKRLRPLLCILSFRACGGGDGNYGDALEVASAVELGHSASLCHDDIVDRDLRRRGKLALWVEEGVPRALLTGHLAISLGLRISLEHGEEIARTYLDAWGKCLRGSMREIEVRSGGKETVNGYMNIIAGKTASLFSAASKAGSIVAGASEELQKLMEDYGMALGMAYQLADDFVELQAGRAEELWVVEEFREANIPHEFLERKIRTFTRKAEKLSRNRKIPESEFKFFLACVPKYFVGQILGPTV